MRFSKLFIIFSIVVASIFGASSAQAVGTIDQQSTHNPNLSANTSSSVIKISQSFTAAATGQLDRVTVAVGRTGSIGNTVFEIFQATNGLPTGNALATQAVNENSISSQFRVSLDVDFSSPASVSSGTHYAIVMSIPQNTSGILAIGFASSYPSGLLSSNTGSGFQHWNGVDTYDMYFQTYVTPAVSSSPQVPAENSAPSLANTGNSSAEIIQLTTFALVAGSSLLFFRRRINN